MIKARIGTEPAPLCRLRHGPGRHRRPGTTVCSTLALYTFGVAANISQRTVANYVYFTRL